MPLVIELTDKPASSAREMIADPLLAFNVALLGRADIRPLAVLLHSEDRKSVVGGLWAPTSFRWLFVELLFVPEGFRAQLLGTKLLELAEAEARKRGCLGAWLDTFNPDARVFYEKRSYRIFGEIGNYPPGNARHFLLKRFDALGGSV